MRHSLKLTLASLFACAAVNTAHAEQVIITEIMYNPAGTKAEYIEIKNISYNARDIVKWYFDKGVTYTFPDFNSSTAQDAFIKPLERIVISSKDAATTRAEYGISAQTRVFGPWTGSLANEGETITLCDKNGVVMGTVSYKDGGRWPKAADGTGHSLMIINENSDPDDWHNWKASPAVRAPAGAGTTTTVVNYTDSWEWNLPTSDPGTSWRTTTGSWGSGSSGTGPGMLGYEASVPAGLPPLQTAVGNNSISQPVYLFRRSFTFNGNASGATFILDSIADDGVTYYLNGNLLGSRRHTPGAWNNLANQPGQDAEEELAILTGSATGLISGNNILAAEVHQVAAANSDMLFAARLHITAGTGAPSSATVRLSEVHFNANGNVDWVEVHNYGSTTQNVGDLFLSSKSNLSDKVALTGTINANSYQSFAIPGSGFETDGGGEVDIYLADSANNILGAADLTKAAGRDSLQAIWPVTPAAKPTWELLKTKPEWYSSTAHSQNAANNNITPAITTAIVINEIMNDPISEQDSMEYIELLNNSGSSVSLAGWKLRGGADFDFPAGTSIPANGYLIVGGNKAHLQTVYGGTVVGNWTGKLANKGEYIRLEDASGNLADEVDFRTEGNWPDLVVNKGSSLELINPNMDNNRASAWRASNESTKGTWATYTANLGPWQDIMERLDFSGGLVINQNRSNATNSQADYKEWHFFGLKDCHIVMKNISLYPTSSNSLDNKLHSPTQMKQDVNSSNGWLAQGTMGPSYMDGEGLHIVANGHGDGTVGKLEIDCHGINQGTNYSVTFEARWVSGVPLIAGQTWDRSIGSIFRINVPSNLGSPGAQNSRFNSNTPPQVDSIIHSPAVPKSNQSVKITARVYSHIGLSSVEARVRQDDINQGYNDNNYSSVTMVDNGTNGDAVSGDGVYTATITNHQVNGRMVQFYVRANASNGQQGVCPPAAGSRPAMWIVDDRTMETSLRRQRFIMSDYDVDGLRSGSGGGTSKYGFRNPRMSNFYYPVTFIHNETDVYYLCEARQSGSRWHRSFDMSTFDRIKWKIPNDRLFRRNSKLYSDKDNHKNSGLCNHLSLYMAYLLGYPAFNQIELVHTAVNYNFQMGVRCETELTDNDLIARSFEDGSNGQLIKCSEQVTLKDDYGDILFAPIDLSYAYRGTDNPTRWIGNFPLRNREWEYEYGSFTELVKTWSNASATREQIERIMDSDMVMLMTAARGYAGDWDSVTYNGKNGNFYRRPSDNKWIYLHWDGDSAFENPDSTESDEIARELNGWKEYLNRPWVRRQLNYYLTEILNKYSKNSPRVLGWLTAQQNGVGSGFTYGQPYAPNAFPYQYTTFFNQKESFTQNFINQNKGDGGAGNALFASFSASGSGGSGTNATATITGTAPSSAYSIAVDNHPEAQLTWNNQTSWTLSGVVLKTGSNNFVLRMLDKWGAQVTGSSTVNWSYNKTNNAAPVMNLAVNPGSYNVTLGEVTELDASTSYDPESSALTFAWTTPGGATVTTPAANPANSKRNATFSIPGIYSFTVTGTDTSANSTPLTREIAVANTADFDSFIDRAIDTTKWTIGGMEVKNNNFPSRWYSLDEKPGFLLINVMESSAKNLTHGNSHPTLLRNMPANGDAALLTEVELMTRKTGTFFTGLYLETSEGKYAFGLENGTHITAKRSTGGAFSNVGSQSATGDNAKLRIRRVGDQLRFERRTDAVWSTLFTHNMAGGSTLSKGGVFLATETAQSARAAFDYVMVVNPGNPGGTVYDSLRITEIMYFPRISTEPEYIEVRNTGASQINLNGVKIDDGIVLNITTDLLLNAGQYAIFTDNKTQFMSVYAGIPTERVVQWTSGKLSNEGENLVLKAGANIIHDFSYGVASPWPSFAAGEGGALEVVSTSGDYTSHTNWRSTGAMPGGGADTDGDGVPDAWEAKFGTNSSSSSSKPRATTAVNGSNQTQISWGGVSGQNYRVEYCDNLGAAWQTVTGASSVPGVNGTASFTDPQLPRPTKRFYRIMAL